MNLPLAWIDEEAAPPEATPTPIPWEDARLSALPALGATLSAVLFRPTACFRSLRLTGGLQAPLNFTLLVSTIGILAALYWHLLRLVARGTENSWLASMGIVLPPLGPHLVVGVVLMVPLFVVLRQYVLSCFLFGALKLVGGQQPTFTAAFRLTAYTQAPLLAYLLPWLGGLVASIWLFILEIKALRAVFSYSLLRTVVVIAVSFFLELLALGVLLLLGSLFGLALGWRLLLA